MEKPTWRALAGVALALAAFGVPHAGTAAAAPPPPDGDIAPDRPPSADDPLSMGAAPLRLMRFPVEGDALYEATFGACRGKRCERRHMGVDLFAPKMRPLVAAQAGVVTWFRDDASGTAGNGVGITDAEGWRYLYLHVNNDTPGTDDGANPPAWRFAPGIAPGAQVMAGQVLGYLGDSGNAETTPPHLHFELRTPARITVDPYRSLLVADAARRVA